MRIVGGLFVTLWLVLFAFAIQTSAVQSVSADAGDQLARGKEMFHIRCEPCHGDVGQGLALWRYTWAPEDQNCSQYKCHALNHPPDGFYMPNDAPPIIGEGTLQPFATARELYAFISKAMPFDKPGELSPEDYWAVTAFLLQQNNKLPAGTRLDASNAASVIVNPALIAAAPTPVPTPAVNAPTLDSNAVWGMAAGVGVILFAIFNYLRRRCHLGGGLR